MLTRRWLLGPIFITWASFGAHAQSVRGVVVDEADRPVGGVVVLLVDSASRAAARALTDERGQFRVAASASGIYRLRTLRIGLRPVVSTPFELRAGAESTKRIVVASLPTSLDTIRVVDRSSCRAFTDSGAATYAIWEQAQAALSATDLTTNLGDVAATTVSYERILDPRASNRVLRQKATVRTRYVDRPWLTPPPDSLRRIGYVVSAGNQSTVYYAPGIDMLLSPAFAGDHCFRLAIDEKRPEVIGLAFEPTPDRRRIPEIKGYFWVDRKSSELRRLDFEYANVSAELSEAAGGDVRFVRMRDGTWVISQWEIRMPAFTSVILRGHGAERQLAEIQVTGGELALARRGTDTLWSEPPVTLTGTIRDSTSGATIAGARILLAGTDLSARSDERGRFSISGVLPGNYEAVVHTPSLDSLSLAHRVPFQFLNPATHVEWRVANARQVLAAVCGPSSAADASRGIIVGRATLNGDSSSLQGVTVLAEWLTRGNSATDTETGTVAQTRVRATADGVFRICRVPMNVSVRLMATADGAAMAEAATVRVPSSARITHRDLVLDPLTTLTARGSSFTGVVVSDSTHLPIGGAEVALPDLSKNAFTDANGAFRIAGIPAGEHRVMVRKLGYGAADTSLTFDGTATVERRVVLGRAVTLEPVVVEATPSEKVRMRSFEDNRRVGLGHFMTRDEIAKFDGLGTGPLVAQISSAVVIGGAAHSWVTSRHAPPTILGRGVHCPSNIEKMQGMSSCACMAHVYVDGVLQNGRQEPAEPFDLAEIPPERIEAIEFYAGAAETPAQYSRMGSQCGVLVIWTRWYQPKPEKPRRLGENRKGSARNTASEPFKERPS